MLNGADHARMVSVASTAGVPVITTLIGTRVLRLSTATFRALRVAIAAAATHY